MLDAGDSAGRRLRNQRCGGIYELGQKSLWPLRIFRGSRYTLPMTRRTLKDLSSDECFTLLGQETVGRLVYVDDLGPAAVPVDYALAGQGIVFRSEDGSKIRGLRGKHDVAFEVDHIDKASRSGWSVLVRGTREEVEFEHLPELLVRIDGYVPLPWKKGIHKIWVVITPKTVTGRRLAGFASEDFF